jgi:beta-lactamase class A
MKGATVVDDRTRDVQTTIAADVERAGCTAAWHVVDLNSGAQIGTQSDAPVVMASVFKVLVALEFYAQVDAGDLDPTRTMMLAPDAHTAGPTGISSFDDPVRISLRDLCRMMMSISDNTATDTLLSVVGLDRVNARARTCGCASTIVESSLKELFDSVAIDIGFASYVELLAAQSGALGPEARSKGADAARIDACAALDPMRTSRSTPRDMTRLLSAIWKDEAALPASCASVRAVMAQQVSTRLGRALPDGATLAAKTGSLFGRIRNEIGVVTHADGRAFATAVFTRAHQPFKRVASIEAEMGRAAASAISALRSASG